MYVGRYIEALSRIHCSRGQELNIIYSECMSVALVIQHAKRVRSVSGSTAFFRIVSNGAKDWNILTELVATIA